MDALPQGARIAIPNDPSNGARALLLLQKSGVITLKSKDNFDYSTADITSNPKHIDFVELDAAQLPRALPDVDAAIINTNFSMLAGLVPSRDAILLEDAKSPYANVIVTVASKAKDPRVLHFVEAMHSHAVAEKAKILFSDQAIQAW
jgi:D-methionine transport system substrate-binding protein